MCGINGIFNYSDRVIADGASLVGRMNDAIAHRGPDDAGLWCDTRARVHLGHRRLSILDLSSSGHQPMVSPRGSVIVFNGEIYNYVALRDSLADLRFVSQSDTEALLAAYDRYGASSLDHLNGMFAFAIWDEKRQELFLARDRIGKKPLYYTEIGGGFAFSSQIKALLTLPWVRAELDEVALYHFLTFNCLMPPQTMFRGIHKLPPGHAMSVGNDGVKSIKPYWEVTYSNYNDLGPTEMEERLMHELERSVQLRMVSDVPVGAFLSGGVDSSTIVALMSKLSPDRVKTYSIGFENTPNYDERIFADSVAKRYNTQHFERIVKPNDLLEFLPRIAEIFDEPLADATSIPIYFISQLARENKTIVVLTGDGADELFCGYRRWARYAKLYPFYRLVMRLPRPVKAALYSMIRRVAEGSSLHEIVARAHADQEFFWGGAGGFREATKRDFLSAAYAQRMVAEDSYQKVLEYRSLFDRIPRNGRDNPDVDWMCFMGLKHIVPDYYLFRADRLGMANSIEIRSPFLDYHLVNFALSLPGRSKIHKGEPKYILKKTAERLLPKELLYRRKQGFCVPLYEWTGDVILDYVESHVAAFCRDTGLFDEARMRDQIKQAKGGSRHFTFALWNFYFLMTWFRKWLV